MIKSYDDVLPSKWGNGDQAVCDAANGTDMTAAIGGFAQAEYQRKHLEAAQKAWKMVENQIRLRTDQCLREALAEAKCAVYDAMHLPDFDYKVAALKEDAASLTLISSRYL